MSTQLANQAVLIAPLLGPLVAAAAGGLLGWRLSIAWGAVAASVLILLSGVLVGISPFDRRQRLERVIADVADPRPLVRLPARRRGAARSGKARRRHAGVRRGAARSHHAQRVRSLQGGVLELLRRAQAWLQAARTATPPSPVSGYESESASSASSSARRRRSDPGGPPIAAPGTRVRAPARRSGSAPAGRRGRSS